MNIIIRKVPPPAGPLPRCAGCEGRVDRVNGCELAVVVEGTESAVCFDCGLGIAPDVAGVLVLVKAIDLHREAIGPVLTEAMKASAPAMKPTKAKRAKAGARPAR